MYLAGVLLLKKQPILVKTAELYLHLRGYEVRISLLPSHSWGMMHRQPW